MLIILQPRKKKRYFDLTCLNNIFTMNNNSCIQGEDWKIKQSFVIRFFSTITKHNPQQSRKNKVSSSFFSRSFYFILSPLYFSHLVLFTLYFPLVFRLGLFFLFVVKWWDKYIHKHMKKSLSSSSSSFSIICVYVTNEGDNSTNTTSRLNEFGRMLNNLTDRTSQIDW
jgi:hypothetical protein